MFCAVFMRCRMQHTALRFSSTPVEPPIFNDCSRKSSIRTLRAIVSDQFTTTPDAQDLDFQKRTAEQIYKAGQARGINPLRIERIQDEIRFDDLVHDITSSIATSLAQTWRPRARPSASSYSTRRGTRARSRGRRSQTASRPTRRRSRNGSRRRDRAGPIGSVSQSARLKNGENIALAPSIQAGIALIRSFTPSASAAILRMSRSCAFGA